MKAPAGTVTIILAGVTVAALLFSLPGSLREALNRGDFYVLSQAFFEDLPKRLTGPGRFRFFLQPLVAMILGFRNGFADARLGRPAYIFGLLFDRRMRPELLKSGFRSIVNLVLVGVLLDSICQWLILGASYPGAALVVGPVLVAAPYSITRALSNRCFQLVNCRRPSGAGSRNRDRI